MGTEQAKAEREMRVFHEFVKAAHLEERPVPIDQEELRSLWFNYPKSGS